MEPDTDRSDSDIRRRAAWLLVMLAVVAGLVAFVMVVFLHTGSSSPSSNNAPYVDPDPSPTSTHHQSSSPAAPSTSASSSAASRLAAPSCPGTSTCAVTGDVPGAQSAINAVRSSNGQSPVTVVDSTTAARCAVSDGNTCPQSFVWVHVSGLSGAQLVTAVEGYNHNDDLLDNNASKFEIGWAYDPASKSLSAAVIRDS